ncbi:MAG: hypothetical protein IIA45_10520 [Bacteroidetes bacterium]|nr:hypothetical protein [Bacteroidota bacterium]
MKAKLLTLIVTMAFSSGLYAGSFSASFSNTTLNGSPNSTISFGGTCTNFDCCNLINLKITITPLSIPADWDFQMDLLGSSVPQGTLTETFFVSPSQVGNISADFIVGNTSTIGNADIRIEDVANPNDYIRFYINCRREWGSFY